MKRKEEGEEEVEDEKEVYEEEEVKEQEVGADRGREGALLVDSQDWFLNTAFRIHFMDFLEGHFSHKNTSETFSQQYGIQWPGLGSW